MVRGSSVRKGDVLLIAKGELVPVDATLRGQDATSVSLDWIHGESEPRRIEPGQTISAGSFLCGESAVEVEASTSFADSPLVTLLSRPLSPPDAQGESPFWDRVARRYVSLVLTVAFVSFAGWYLGTGDLGRALEITTAILVVTCPCGIGIATPLGYELAGSALRRAGLFVRRERLLERVPQIRRVVFDKTGTLTTGTPRVANAQELETLAPSARMMLADLVARSAHPKSVAIHRALSRGEDEHAIAVRSDVRIVEVPGRGLEGLDQDDCYRLGQPEWAAPNAHDAHDADLVFSRNGELILALSLEEELRPDAHAELQALHHAGFETWILSGDEPSRVRVVARALGIPEERALGGCTPDDKASWVRLHDRNDTLFIGDGINDGPAADLSFTAGTPAIERPFLPSRADFWFVTPGLGPIRLLLELGHRLRMIARRNLIFAVFYNTFAVTLAVLGFMQPWLAAVLMPASSLVVIAATSASLRSKNAIHESSRDGRHRELPLWRAQWTS
jgi:Cu2+-exporting ATPase